MVIYDKGQLGQAAKKSGFVRDTFEKVLRLKEILVYLKRYPWAVRTHRDIL